MNRLLLKIYSGLLSVFSFLVFGLVLYMVYVGVFRGIFEPLWIWLQFGNWPERDLLFLLAPENCEYSYLRGDGITQKDWCREDYVSVSGWIGVDKILNYLMDALNLAVVAVLVVLAAGSLLVSMYEKLEDAKSRANR